MPFEPRIYPADRSPQADVEELRLPPDLLDLAARLSFEAEDLALHHPAPRHRQAGRWFALSRWAVGGVAAAAIAAAVFGRGLTLLEQQPPATDWAQENAPPGVDSRVGVSNTRFRDARSHAVVVNNPRGRRAVVPAVMTVGAAKAAPDIVPAALFLDLSGAEQEALLDLVDERALQQSSLNL